MAMAEWKSVFSRIFWKNKRSGGTALDAANLNTYDVAMQEIDTRILQLRDAKFDASNANSLIKGWKIDEATGVITVTWFNNTTQIFDLNIEKIPVNFEMSDDGILTMTTEDGTEFKTDIKKAIPIYTFLNSKTVKVTFSTGKNGEKQYKFDVVDGSIDGSKLSPDYLAQMNTSLENSKSSEENASSFSAAAQKSAQLAKSYCTGATGTREGEDKDNAKYYSELSKGYAKSINIASTAHTGIVRPDGTTITVDADGTIHSNYDSADLKNNKVTFTTADVADSKATAWTSVTPLASGSTLSTLLQRLSQMCKNVRYLYNLLGTTDISAIGGKGTITSAISALNTMNSWKVDIDVVADMWQKNELYAAGDYCIYNGLLWRCKAATGGTEPVSGDNWKAVSVVGEVKKLNRDLGGHSIKSDVPANAKFTDTNTWRNVQDNLNSTSTTESLSANQGRILNDKFKNYEPKGNFINNAGGHGITLGWGDKGLYAYVDGTFVGYLQRN